MLKATTIVANLKKGDKLTFINFTKKEQTTVYAFICTEYQYNKLKTNKIGDYQAIVIGTPLFNLLNTATLFRTVSIMVAKKYKLKVKLLEVEKTERKWYTITQLKQRFKKILRILY